MRNPLQVALPLILAVIFLFVMSAFTQTYAWANTQAYWAIFGMVEIVLVFFGLIKAVK
jgi:hypothetical protein